MDRASNIVSGGMARTIFMIFVFIIVAVFLFYLYKWLFGSSEIKDYVVYSSTNTGLVATDTPTIGKGLYDSTNVPPMYTGGEYSISTWIYVKAWSNEMNKPFLILYGGGNSYNTMVLYLGKSINKLGVRITSSPANDGTIEAGQTPSDQYASITSTNPSEPYNDATFAQCDIDSIDLQRWVNITTVVSGKTVDVYIDGKLSRSVVMKGPVQFDGSSTKLQLGDTKGFKGYIGRTRAANFAYSPDIVYRYYQYGPFTGAFSLLNLNFSKFTFDIKQDGVSIFGSD